MTMQPDEVQTIEGQAREALGGIDLTPAAPLAVPAATRVEVVPIIFDPLPPAQRFSLAMAMAPILRDIVDKGKRVRTDDGTFITKPLVTSIPQKDKDTGQIISWSEHVHVEAWQALGFLCGVTARIAWCREVPDSPGEYEARAEVVRFDNGLIIGAGEGTCSKDEKRGPWRYADKFAVKAMAQTRATSRSLRGILAWIMVLAGYAATPYEEMQIEDEGNGGEGLPALPAGGAKAQKSRAAQARSATSHKLGRPVDLLNHFAALKMGGHDAFEDFVKKQVPGAQQRITRSSDLMHPDNADLYEATATMLNDIETEMKRDAQ